MESNQNISKDIVKENKKINYDEVFQNQDYLYPNGHRITHQMRWYKVSRDRGFRSNTAA